MLNNINEATTKDKECGPFGSGLIFSEITIKHTPLTDCDFLDNEPTQEPSEPSEGTTQEPTEGDKMLEDITELSEADKIEDITDPDLPINILDIIADDPIKSNEPDEIPEPFIQDAATIEKNKAKLYKLYFNRCFTNSISKPDPLNICKCGIEHANICCCKNPKIITNRLNNKFFCANCDKWLCQC